MVVLLYLVKSNTKETLDKVVKSKGGKNIFLLDGSPRRIGSRPHGHKRTMDVVNYNVEYYV